MHSGNRAEARITPQDVRQLHHPRSKVLQHGLSTLAFGTMDCPSPLEANNFLLSVSQPQAHELVCTLASALLQRTPSTKNARGGLPQDEQKERKIKHNNRNGQVVTPIKIAQIHHHKGGILQPKVSDDTTRLRFPLARRGGIFSIHNFLQATSQISGSLTLLDGVIGNSLNQRVVNGNSVPHKNNKGRRKSTHHVLAN